MLSSCGFNDMNKGFTKIPNNLIEALSKINLWPYESRLVWFILRKTKGFHKKEDWIALSQFTRGTGLDRRYVHRARKSLERKGIVVTSRDDKKKPKYRIQLDCSKWKLSPLEMTKPVVASRDDKVVPEQVTKVVPQQAPTKETLTKEKYTKERKAPNTEESGSAFPKQQKTIFTERLEQMAEEARLRRERLNNRAISP